MSAVPEEAACGAWVSVPGSALALLWVSSSITADGGGSALPAGSPASVRGLASDAPRASLNPCGAGQYRPWWSPVVPSQISSSPPSCQCNSVLDLCHTYPFPPPTWRPVAWRAARQVFRGDRPLPSPGVRPQCSPWGHPVLCWLWRGQCTSAARGLCLRMGLRVTWSRWRAACGPGDCLRPVCCWHVSQPGRGCLAVCPSKSMSQLWPLRLWSCGVRPVALRPRLGIGVQGMRRHPGGGWTSGRVVDGRYRCCRLCRGVIV